MDSIAWIWREYGLFVDIALYFFVFAAAARAAFTRSFPGREGRILAVAIGLLLAVALGITRRIVGLSLERIGPAAIFILCIVVLVTAYKFLHHAGIPVVLRLILSVLLILVLARVTMPNLTGRLVEAIPILGGVVLVCMIVPALLGIESHASTVVRRRPGFLLARQHLIPDQEELGREARFVKKRLIKSSKRNRSDEVVAEKEIKRAEATIEKVDSARNRQSETKTINDILQRTREIRERTQSLLTLDEMLRRFDLGQLQEAHDVKLNQLTPAQQEILRRALLEERELLVREGMIPARRHKGGRHRVYLREDLDQYARGLERVAV